MRTINMMLVILFVGAAYAAAQEGSELARPAVTFIPFADDSPVGEELPPLPGAPFDVEAPMPWLADGIPGLLELALERGAAANLVSRTDLALSLKKRRNVGLAADTPFEVVAEVAEREGARYVVGGSFTKEKKDLSLTVKVWEIGAEVAAVPEVEGPEEYKAEMDRLEAELEKMVGELREVVGAPGLSAEEKEVRAAAIEAELTEKALRMAELAKEQFKIRPPKTIEIDPRLEEGFHALVEELEVVLADAALSWDEKEARAAEIRFAMDEMVGQIMERLAVIPKGEYEEFSGGTGDVFSLVNEAAKFVLEATGAGEEAILIPRPPIANMEAFKWFAKGAASPYTGEQISFFLSATEKDANFAGAHLRLAKAYRGEKNYEDAKASYEKVRELADYYPSAPYGLALISRALEPENADAAVALLDEALAIDPSYAPVYEARGAVYFAAQDYEKAREAYETFIAIWPTSKDGYYALGNTLWLIGKDSPQWKSLLRAAIQSYEKSLSVDPDFAACHYNLASVYKIFEDVEKAIYHYRRYVELEPDSPRRAEIEETIADWEEKYRLK
ncbi:MAG: tetratricopeptide repeat protein [candidate division Zixibacteria bacterium]|nr:tetratricopeptide repeat protein [candidate division Zixibacteria bacterium]